MATRSSDTRLDILLESPGPENVHINGTRLLTYNQVLLCFLANFEHLRLQDSTKNLKLTRRASSSVVGEVQAHYQKAHLPTINEIKMIEKVERLHQEYVGLKKLNPDRRLQNPKVKSFREKLLTTMPFWPDDTEKKLEENKKGKTDAEKFAIDEDLDFLRSMMTD